MAGFGRSNSLSINTGGGGGLLYVHALQTTPAPVHFHDTILTIHEWQQQCDTRPAGWSAPEQWWPFRINSANPTAAVGITVRRPEPDVATLRRPLWQQACDYGTRNRRPVRLIDGAIIAASKWRSVWRRIRREYTEPDSEHRSVGGSLWRRPGEALDFVSKKGRLR